MESQQFSWILSLYWLDRYNRAEEAGDLLRGVESAAGAALAQAALIHLPDIISFGSRLRNFLRGLRPSNWVRGT